MTVYSTFEQGDVHVYDGGIDHPQLTIETKDGLRWSDLTRCASLEQLAILSDQGYVIPANCFCDIRSDLGQPMPFTGVDRASGDSYSVKSFFKPNETGEMEFMFSEMV